METFTRDLDFVNFIDTNGNEHKDLDFVKFNGVTVYEAWKELTASGVPPLTLLKCKGVDLVDYKIHGDSVQEGENLFNPSITLTDGIYLNNTGTEVSHASWKVTDYIEVNGHSFTLTNVGGMSPSVCAYDENKNFVTGVNYGTTNDDTKTSVTITSETLIKNIRISIYRVWVENNTINDIKLRYLPTPETPIEVESVGEKTKNLLPINGNYTTTHKEASLTIENDVITLDGYIDTNTQWGIYQDNGELKTVVGVVGTEHDLPNLMSLKVGSYTMSLKYISGTIETTSSSTNIYFGLYTRKNGVNLIDVRQPLVASDRLYRFTVNEDVDAQFLVFQFVGMVNQITFNNLKFKIQIEEGLFTTATEYEPYGYKIPVKVSDELGNETVTTNIYLKEPLRKIGNYADYIDFEKKQVVRNITEYIVPSNITWDMELGDSYNLVRFRITKEQIVGQKVPFTEQKCNYALCDEQTTSGKAEGVSVYYSTSLGGSYFRARNTTDFSSPAEYRAFVEACSDNGKPFKVYFDNYEPTEEDIELPNIPTIKGTTIIEVDTTIEPSNMEVTYIGKK